DGAVESTDDEKRLRRFDGNVARAVSLKSECGTVDRANRAVERRTGARLDRESVDTIAVVRQRLQLVEMHPHAVLGARNLGRIRATAYERGNDHGIAGAAPL